jgi:hypothetical protein
MSQVFLRRAHVRAGLQQEAAMYLAAGEQNEVQADQVVMGTAIMTFLRPVRAARL